MVAIDSSDEKVKHFRVDKMLNIEFLDKPRLGGEKFSGQNADVGLYAKKVFGMFSGEEEIIKLECKNEMAGEMCIRDRLKAVQSVQNPTLLLAVPGSGKTTVLVTRLGYMIYCLGIEPESILTITYTVAATNYMRQRFETMFGEQLAARLEFRTINGICSKIINYYGNCCLLYTSRCV